MVLIYVSVVITLTIALRKTKKDKKYSPVLNNAEIFV